MLDDAVLRWQKEQLIATVTRLSLEATKQIEYLCGLRCSIDDDEGVVDELVLEYDDARDFAPALVERGRLTQAQLGLLESLDARIESLQSEVSSIWEVPALRSHDRWREVREAALACVHSFVV